MIYGITLVILGLLAVPSLLAKSPKAKEALEKLVPYQGWAGVVFCIWGVWGIIDAILHIGWLTDWPIVWILWLAASVVEAVLGFLLGYGLIAKYALSKNETAKEKGEQLLKKLTPLQGTFGILGIIVGIIYTVAYIVLI